MSMGEFDIWSRTGGEDKHFGGTSASPFVTPIEGSRSFRFLFGADQTSEEQFVSLSTRTVANVRKGRIQGKFKFEDLPGQDFEFGLFGHMRSYTQFDSSIERYALYMDTADQQTFVLAKATEFDLTSGGSTGSIKDESGTTIFEEVPVTSNYDQGATWAIELEWNHDSGAGSTSLIARWSPDANVNDFFVISTQTDNSPIDTGAEDLRVGLFARRRQGSSITAELIWDEVCIFTV